MYEYLLFDEDGTLMVTEVLPDTVSWDTWPKVTRICIISYGDEMHFEKLTKDGWEELWHDECK